MALQMTKTFDNQITVENCYFKISSISGDKNQLFVNVKSYVSKEVADADTNGVNNIDQSQFSFTPSSDENSKRWDKQAYVQMKTLPEYAGAIDVLEEGQTSN